MPVVPVPTQTNRRNDSAQADLYRRYQNDLSFASVGGLLVLPCGDGPPTVVRVHSEYAVRVQQFDIEKDCTPPVFPAPNPSLILLSQQINTPLPQALNTNPPSDKYRISGSYTYLIPDSFVASGMIGDGKSFSVSPWPFRFPALGDAGAAIAGGAAQFAQFELFTTDSQFSTGEYSWPWVGLSAPPRFADENLS